MRSVMVLPGAASNGRMVQDTKVGIVQRRVADE